MKAVISVIGKDAVGILAKVSGRCFDGGINVTDVTQSILQDMFVMIMMVEFSEKSIPFSEFDSAMAELGKKEGLVIHVMNYEIFQAMHKI